MYIFLQRHGLSLDAARAVWREIIQRQLSAERNADRIEQGRDTPLTFEEIKKRKYEHWTPGADNTPPRNLPDILKGDLEGPIAAISVRSNRQGIEGAFDVSVWSISNQGLLNWAEKAPGDWRFLIGAQHRETAPKYYSGFDDFSLAPSEGREFQLPPEPPLEPTQLLGTVIFANLNALIWQINQGIAAEVGGD